LGRLDPALFAGGTMPLDEAAAQKSFAPLGADAAIGVAEIVDETMASAARVHAVENGEDTAGRTMIAFGGAAPLHAARLAQKLGITRVVVPLGAGVASALGFLVAPPATDLVRSHVGRLERLDWAVGDGADLVIVELGANDMLRGVDPQITRKALAEIIMRLQAKKIPVLLAGMVAAPGMGRDYETKFNAIYGDLAREFGVALYPFFLDGVAGNRSLLLQDGLHPTPEGVETIVRGILPSVEALLPKP
jgi:N-methylhydantoinase A/oxoprolinase/acetone carboxylase beta subunit